MPKTEEELKALMEGKDAELTDMIYGIQKKPEYQDTDILPDNNGMLRGESDPLQLFINMYQPGEFVTKQNFRKHLLQILNNWHQDAVKKEEWAGTHQIGITLKQTEAHVQWGTKANDTHFYVKAKANFDRWLFDDTMTENKKTVGTNNQKQLHKDLDAFIAKFKEK